MTHNTKRAVFTLCGGVLLILSGIFLLYMNLPASQCLNKSDFFPINSQSIHNLAPFIMIFIGVLTELFGRFKLAKAADDMQIFYNRLNLYFLITLFILVSLKTLMAESENLFLVKICVSDIRYGKGLFGDLARSTAVWFLVVLIVYFLLKDSVYFARVFKSILPIAAFAVCAVSIFLFFSKDILSSNSLEEFISIKIFIPYFVIHLIMYAKILKYPVAHKAKEFSFYNYFAFNKKKVFLIFLVASLIISAVFSILSSMYLIVFLFILPIAVVSFAPLLFFKISSFGKSKISAAVFGAVFVCLAIFIVMIYGAAIPILILLLYYITPLIVIGFLPFLFFLPMPHERALIIIFCMFLLCLVFYFNPLFYISVLFYTLVLPISLALCIILKLQQKGLMKTSTALMIASCISLGYLFLY
ncbi:MAG: hypothetical protein LBG21_06350 [Campylobacteraceae bacterium]|jgi:hypothetical protein|nr:hypothetical protein [Campylobacteraceae bacterium]